MEIEGNGYRVTVGPEGEVSYDFSAKYSTKAPDVPGQGESGQENVETAEERHEREYSAYLRAVGDTRGTEFSSGSKKSGEERDPASAKHHRDYEAVLGQLGKPSEINKGWLPGWSEPQIRRYFENEAIKEDVNTALKGRGWSKVRGQ